MSVTLVIVVGFKEDETSMWKGRGKRCRSARLLDEAKEDEYCGAEVFKRRIFYPDLIYSGEIMKGVAALLESKLKEVRDTKSKNWVKLLLRR